MQYNLDDFIRILASRVRPDHGLGGSATRMIYDGHVHDLDSDASLLAPILPCAQLPVVLERGEITTGQLPIASFDSELVLVARETQSRPRGGLRLIIG